MDDIMPGKFSKQPTTPNKPPVCHKAPLVPVPFDVPLWKRNASIVINWWGDPSIGSPFRTWMLTLTPGPWEQSQHASEDAYPIAVRVNIDHFTNPTRWGYGIQVYTATEAYLDMDESNLLYQTVDPWHTGLATVIPNLYTARCTLYALS